MDNLIDLGEELVIPVKYAGQVYSLREPTVSEVDKFRGLDKDLGADAIVSFLETLGLPKDVALKMGMSKQKQLIDGLMDVMTKKK